VALTEPLAATCLTDATREIMAGATSGSSADFPNSVWPFFTVSRLVPRRSISDSSPA
jgi:hypothetical protein